ncbi:two-component regulator propeller domain-containing protein [Paraflavisolibacter sp. H34]|uniref:ligand-binding sensor domain-containing protein n=1 Tax=Huijunlia imazamoxiresistens TaxID=3127457 RepID=UPI003018F804
MSLRILFLFGLLFLLPAARLPAQPVYFRHYQVENGLSNNAVIATLQDRKGFMWFGTKDGLNRFDGYSFKVFRNNPDDSGSIGNNFIHSLYEDPEGVLWVGTNSGLCEYNATSESFREIATPMHYDTREMQLDRAGNLWFISGFTLFRYHKKTQELRVYPADRYFQASALHLAADGTLWAGTNAGTLERYAPATDNFTAYNILSGSPSPGARRIEKIYGGGQGQLLVGTSNQGVKLFSPATGAFRDLLTYNPDRTSIFARDFIRSGENEYWIATESGIYIYNAATGRHTNLRKRYNNPYSLSDNAVYSFCRDKEGGIWAGTYFGGVNYYPAQYTSFKKYFPKVGENSLSGNVIREIRQDNRGHLWLGTEDAGLNRMDTATGAFTHFQPTGAPGSISYANIHGLYTRGNELWIGTFLHGLDVLDLRTHKVIRHYNAGPGPRALKSDFIYCLYGTPRGELWLGTTTGAFAYHRATNDFSPLPGLPQDTWYTCLYQDGGGTTWAGSYGNGLSVYDSAAGRTANFRYDPKNRNSLASDRVNSIFEDSRHRLWIATEGGLCRYRPQTADFQRYTTANGFPSNFFLSILEDQKQQLWISTSRGLVCFDPASEKLNVYTRANGLLNDQFNFNSAYKDPSGRMYFGSVKGLISFKPEEFHPNTFVPPVYITGIQVNNRELEISPDGSPLKQSITYTRSITLTYRQSTFGIDFAALSYTDPDRLEYAYRMEGLDKTWTHLKTNRKAYFTELAAGTYVFKVKASNGSGAWNGQEARLIIKVLPPWWASRLAKTIYILTGLLLLFLAALLYYRRTEARNRRKIELLQVAKEHELFQAKMEFFTNVAHEIRTPLTLIKGPLEKVMRKAEDVPGIGNSLRIIERNTNRLVDLTNQLLDFRQTEIQGFSLNFTPTNITELLEEHFGNFKSLAEQKSLRYELELPAAPLTAWVDGEALNKMVTNLLGNAVKYAASAVVMRLLPFSEEDAHFVVEVKSDGFLIPADMSEKIFEPFFRLKETEKQKGTGIGLALARSLAQLHKGTLYLKEPGEGMNVFCLELPLKQE